MKFALIVPTLVLSLSSFANVPKTHEFPQVPQFGADGAYSIAVADFNSDGKADMAISNNNLATNEPNSITLLLGNGDGTFKTSSVYCGSKAWANVLGIAAADVNNDGKEDIVATENDGSLCVLLGNGDGTFQNPIMMSVGTNLVAVGVGDFNGDGKVDAAVADYGTGNAYILLGNGDGTFVLKSTYVVNQPYYSPSIAVGDLNHDGKLDLVFPTSAVLLGVGDGTFKMTWFPPIPGAGSAVTIADFNGDGIPDLAVTNSSTTTNDISIMFGRGDGTFQNPINYRLDLPPYFVAAGDLNHDGEPDLAITNQLGVEVLLNYDHGSFKSPITYTADKTPATVAIHDFNGDKNPDLAVTDGLYPDENVSILLGNGDGTFVSPMKNLVSATDYYPTSAAMADLNRDGRTDVAVATQNGVRVFLAGKNGALAPVGTFGTNASYVATGDMNGDGKPDLITLTGSSIGIMLGNGNGTFRQQMTYAANASSLTVGDFNGDGKLDAAVTSPSGITVYLGKGDGMLGQSFTSPANGAQGIMVVADFNGDKKLDVAVLGSLNGGITVLLGNGDGTFAAPQTYFTTFSPGTLLACDLNRDGKPDLVFTDYLSGPYVFVALGNGDGTFQSPVSYGSGGVTSFLAAGDFNGDGKVDIAVAYPKSYPLGDEFGGAISILLGNGDGTLQAETWYSAGTWPQWVGAADLNGDGAPDLVSVNNIDYFYPPLSLTVFLNLGGTALHLTSSRNPSRHGEVVSFTTTVGASVRGPKRHAPTGSVTFHDGKIVLGTVKLSGGKAEFTASKLSVGTHSISAHYSGDNNFNPHTSAVLKQVVKK